MSADFSDASLLDLYRMEAETQLAALNRGLVDLEPGTVDPKRIEPLMRAAHSLKGAARIVGLDHAVKLAHAMEDVLVAAQEGRLALSAASVDILLKASDFLAELSRASDAEMQAWGDARGSETASILDALAAVKEGRPASAGEPPSAVSAQPPAEPALPPSQPATLQPAPEASAAPAPATAAPTRQDLSVRVSSERLTRLMGLAAESLVEARALEPLRASLLRLKQDQQRRARELEELSQCATGADATLRERLEALHHEARAQVDLVRRELEQFDAFTRRNTLLADRLYREVLASRMRPFDDGVQGLPRLVRDLARTLGKQIKLEITGRDTPVDRDVLERLDGPLNHLIRNACDHGVETPQERAAAGKPEAARILVEASHGGGMLRLRIADDGRGINLGRLREKVLERNLVSAEMAAHLTSEELLEFLFLPGFSTASQVTEISGRGVGLDVVQALVQELGGQVRIETELGKGTAFVLQLPITRSVIRALLVTIAGEPYAFPLNRVKRALRLPAAGVRTIEGRAYASVDGVNIGLVGAHEVLELDPATNAHPEELQLVVVSDGRDALYGLEVDALVGEGDIVVRPLDRRLGKIPGIGAASLTESGDPLLIIDVEDMVTAVEKLLSSGHVPRAARNARQTQAAPQRRILVVDDSLTVRETERQILENAGFAVEVAVDGADGWNALRLSAYDLVVSDVDMPRMNGFELVAKIRHDARLRQLPVIIVSYKDRPEDRQRGLDVGADRYLTKSSFHDQSFLEAIRELIGDATS